VVKAPTYVLVLFLEASKLTLIGIFSGYEVARADTRELITIVDIAEHSKRRRVWDRAFTPASIKSYAPLLQNRVEQLLDALGHRVGQPINIKKWFSFMSIDYMSDFSFGGDFDFMARGKDYLGLQKLSVQLMGSLEFLGTISWLRPIILCLPEPGGARELFNIAFSAIKNRQVRGNQRPDLFHHLVRQCPSAPLVQFC
jgi:cytochrome P450